MKPLPANIIEHQGARIFLSEYFPGREFIYELFAGGMQYITIEDDDILIGTGPHQRKEVLKEPAKITKAFIGKDTGEPLLIPKEAVPVGLNLAVQ